MPVDVLTYLQAKGLHVKRATGSEVHVACMYCNEDEGKRGRLYVNTDPDAAIPGLHHCKLCGAKGSIITLQKFYGDPILKEDEDDDHVREVLAEAATYYHDCLVDHPEAFGWLKHDRGLSVQTIVDHQLGYAGGGLYRHLREQGFSVKDIEKTGLVKFGQKINDFFTDAITIPYHAAGNVVLIRGRDMKGGKSKYLTPPHQKARLFNSDLTWGAEEILIAEGEFDALLLEQIGYSAVGVPGANTWQDSWDGYFHDARRVYVVYDRDENDVGQKAAEKLADRLGPKTRVVTLPEHDEGKSKNDITEYFVTLSHTAEEFAELLRGTTSSLLITVDEAVAEHALMASLKPIKFGFEHLDTVIHPGLLPSQVMVVLAQTGAGKTIFLLNIMHRVCSGDPEARVLFVSLEQTRSDWWERARRIYRFHNPDASDDDAAAFWRERILMIDKNRVSEEQLLQALDAFHYEMGKKPTLVCLDYLGYWAQSFKGERYERVSDAIMALKGICKDQMIPIVAPHQVNRSSAQGTRPNIDQARESGVVGETADFLFSIWSPDSTSGKPAEERTGELDVSVEKSRSGGAGTLIKLQFAPISLAIVSPHEIQKAQWARDEVYYRYHWKQHSFEETLIRHQVGLGIKQENYTKVEEAWRSSDRHHLRLMK